MRKKFVAKYDYNQNWRKEFRRIIKSKTPRITQRQVAKDCGVSESWISYVLSDYFKAQVSPRLARKLSEITNYKISAKEILER
jgi:transcriptional regulator with XRE-family HTH domain